MQSENSEADGPLAGRGSPVTGEDTGIGRARRSGGGPSGCPGDDLRPDVVGAIPCVNHSVARMVAAGVRLNSVQPGFVATEIVEGIPRDSSAFESYLVDAPLGGVSDPGTLPRSSPSSSAPPQPALRASRRRSTAATISAAVPDFRPFTGLTPDRLFARVDG